MSTRKRSSRPPSLPAPPRAPRITAGIDVGAVSTKAAVVREGGLLSHAIVPTGADGAAAARACYRAALRRAALPPGAVAAVAATGYGRRSVANASSVLTEITCHARGASLLFPGADTVIDIGGQDTKIVSVRGGLVADFVMNDRCAAGTGRFLEIMARALEIPLEEMGRACLRARRGRGERVRIANTCTVFAESEVVSLLARRKPKSEIVLALHEAVADRIAGMASRLAPGRRVVLSGGVAKNEGAADCIARRLGVRLLVPPEPQIIGALGAALLAGG